MPISAGTLAPSEVWCHLSVNTGPGADSEVSVVGGAPADSATKYSSASVSPADCDTVAVGAGSGAVADSRRSESGCPATYPMPPSTARPNRRAYGHHGSGWSAVITATKYAPAVASETAANPPPAGRRYLSIWEA